jgi:zinc protease
MRKYPLLLMLYATTAAAGVGTSPPGVTIPDVKQWSLPNGMKVIFLADHKAPVVTVQVFYHVGGKDEPADKRGIAHMFEHMMFKGSTHMPPEAHARFIDSVGGNENAFTTDDETGYHDTIPPAALDFTLKLEAERMRNLKLTQKTVDSEREVVKEELRLRLENSPVTKALDRVLHLAYTVHPYQQIAVGQKKMLDTVTVADCQKFYDTFYQPNNAVLIVVGDTDEKTVRELADKHFAPLPKGPETARKKIVEPPQSQRREETLTMPVQLPAIVGAYHIPAGESQDMYALAVLQQILSGGESSRLYQRIVRKDKTAVFAGGGIFEHEDPGLFFTFAVFLPGSDTARIRSAFDEEIAKLIKEPPTAHELEKAKHQLAAQAVYAREKVARLATEMGKDGVVAHDPLESFTAPAKYDAVTAADVQRVTRQYLIESNLSQVTLQPGGAK